MTVPDHQVLAWPGVQGTVINHRIPTKGAIWTIQATQETSVLPAHLHNLLLFERYRMVFETRRHLDPRRIRDEDLRELLVEVLRKHRAPKGLKRALTDAEAAKAVDVDLSRWRLEVRSWPANKRLIEVAVTEAGTTNITRP